jgi:hypothetical protein
MLRHGLGPARLAALAIGALALTIGSARAQITYEFANATNGVAQTNFSVAVGGSLPIQIYLHELTPGAPMFNGNGGLGSGGVRFSFNTPTGIAGLALTDVSPATTAAGGLWDLGTPTLNPGISAAIADGALATGVKPDAQGRILLGTFTLHGLTPGMVTLGAADPNSAIGFDTSSFVAGANGIPLINYDPNLLAKMATLTVTPVPEPASLLAACTVAAGLTGAVRRIRRRTRAAFPTPLDHST